MIREFEVKDSNGKTIAHGEQDGDIYRLFTENGHREFASVDAVLRATGGHALQPALFETQKSARQFGLFPTDSKPRTDRHG